MAPIPKLTIPISQFRTALQLGKSVRVLGSEQRDSQNKFGNRVPSLCTHHFRISPNLNGKIDERNHDANRANNLSDIRQVVQIHSVNWSRITCHSSLLLQLSLVIGGVEMTFGF